MARATSFAAPRQVHPQRMTSMVQGEQQRRMLPPRLPVQGVQNPVQGTAEDMGVGPQRTRQGAFLVF